MSLRDQSCYTLTFIPASDTVLKLNENTGIATLGDERYVRVLENKPGEEYSAALYDALSGARLASTGYVSEKAKSRRLELHGPDEVIPWENTGKLGYEWTFTFEGTKYSWKRNGTSSKELRCVMKRGGDPAVEICLYRTGNSDRRSKFEILHYNLERFLNTEIKDIRGLETLLSMTAVSLDDIANDRRTGPSGTVAAGAAATKQKPASPAPSKPAPGRNPSPAPPPVPPKTSVPSPPPVVPPPPPQQLLDLLQEEEDGEVLVGVNTDLEEHIHRANRLLFDESVLFIIIRSRHPDASARAMEVSLGVQRYRHRNMLPELHRYVTEEEEEPKGPRVIKLDDPPAKQAWKPPPRLAIYLSRIELPDLVPKSKPKSPGPITSPTSPVPKPTPTSPLQTNMSSRPHGRPMSGGPHSTNGGRLSPQPGYQTRIQQPRPQHLHQGVPPSLPPRVTSPGSRPTIPPQAPQQQESFFSNLLRPTWK